MRMGRADAVRTDSAEGERYVEGDEIVLRNVERSLCWQGACDAGPERREEDGPSAHGRFGDLLLGDARRYDEEPKGQSPRLVGGLECLVRCDLFALAV